MAAARPAAKPTTPLKPLFLLGDEIIDRDHRGLHAQFQAVIDSDNVAFPTALRTLLMHTEQHFEREHELMAKYRYIGLRDHRTGHRLILREFQRCLERVDSGQLEFARTFVSERLVPWFELHVSSMDFVFVLYIQKQLATQRSF
jgi:hemerythrin-like metal-binding protein